jgi:cysteine desulfurase
VNSGRIYLDHAATTPLRSEAADAMRAALDANYNPSSLHAEGRRARAALEAARESIATLLGASRNEIVFTSGGTEANNLSLLGIARAGPPGARIVAVATEHAAVLGTLDRLAADGFEIAILPVGADGQVDAGAFEAALGANASLASVMYANNEIGTIAPVAELAAIARMRGARFHTDAVQAPSWLPLDVGALGVDALALSAHKFGGPKGVGLLYLRDGVALEPVIHGGGQERGRRSGTPNVAAIVATARALSLAQAERAEQAARVAALRDRLEAGIRAAISPVRINGGEKRLANNLSVSFAGVETSALLIALDLAGIAVSAGSACASGSLEPSHVLAALSPEHAWQGRAIRFSLGRETSREEVDRVLAVLPGLVAELRCSGDLSVGGMNRLETNGARLEAEA